VTQTLNELGQMLELTVKGGVRARRGGKGGSVA
jgi:hypothetical protein